MLSPPRMPSLRTRLTLPMCMCRDSSFDGFENAPVVCIFTVTTEAHMSLPGHMLLPPLLLYPWLCMVTCLSWFHGCLPPAATTRRRRAWLAKQDLNPLKGFSIVPSECFGGKKANSVHELGHNMGKTLMPRIGVILSCRRACSAYLNMCAVHLCLQVPWSTENFKTMLLKLCAALEVDAPPLRSMLERLSIRARRCGTLQHPHCVSGARDI